MAMVDRKRAAKPREGSLPSPVAKKAKPAPSAGARPAPPLVALLHVSTLLCVEGSVFLLGQGAGAPCLLWCAGRAV
jgi:hypothetical protein